MEELSQRQRLEALKDALHEMEGEERYQDIIPNLQGAVHSDLQFVLENNENLGRDDRLDVEYCITITRRRREWLKAHPGFEGDLISLRAAMGEIDSRTTLRSATYDTEPPESGERAPDTERTPIISPPQD